MLANPERKANSGDLLDDNQIEILGTLEESVFFILQQLQIDDINNSLQISSIQLGNKNRIYLSCLFFYLENFAHFNSNQFLGITSDFFY